MYVPQFNYHTSFLYPFSLRTRQRVHLCTLFFIPRKTRDLSLSLVSTGPHLRPETSKLSVTVGEDLQRSVFADEQPVCQDNYSILLQAFCQTGQVFAVIAGQGYRYSIFPTHIYAGLDSSANHAIPLHISLGLVLHATIPKESILTIATRYVVMVQ